LFGLEYLEAFTDDTFIPCRRQHENCD
jgi:hypothetical protein